MPAENVAPELAGVDAQAYLNVKGTGLKIKPSLLKYFYEKQEIEVKVYLVK